jgi:threonine dehydrogenase-like Zn-dependent dehydrogenase
LAGWAGQVAERIKEITNHKGVDVLFEVSGSYAAATKPFEAWFIRKVIIPGFLSR